jgi:hypothetical protein
MCIFDIICHDSKKWCVRYWSANVPNVRIYLRTSSKGKNDE